MQSGRAVETSVIFGLAGSVVWIFKHPGPAGLFDAQVKLPQASECSDEGHIKRSAPLFVFNMFPLHRQVHFSEECFLHAVEKGKESPEGCRIAKSKCTRRP